MKLFMIDERKKAFSIFMIIFLTSSFVVCNDIFSSAITMALWLLLLLLHYKWIRFQNTRLLIPTIIMLVCMGISTFFNSEDIRVYVLLCFSYFVSMLIVSKISWEEFKELYCKVLYLLCLISIICYIAYFFIPQLNSLFVVNNKAGISYSNLILYVNTSHYLRNMGMFWEPGAFQTFIILAILFEVNKSVINRRYILVMVIALFTTYSTTGYIGLLMAVIYWYSKKGVGNGKKIAIIILAVVGVSFIYFNPAINSILFGNSLSNGQATVFGKIFKFFSSEPGGTAKVLSSSDVRYNSIFEVLKAFFERPIVGYGYQGLINRTRQYTAGMNTCTFVNWFSTYGLVYGIVSVGGIISLAKKENKNILSSILFVFTMFIITMSENYAQNAFIFMLVLYGYRRSVSNYKIG